jgi:glycosyltransferase involved in cell wall biosynthesis
MFWRMGPKYRVAAAATLPMRVLLIAPYTPQGGGIGRMMAYLAECHADSWLRFCMIESRGGGSALSSIGPMLRAAWLMWVHSRYAGDVVAHVNMAERGSVYRKGMLLLWGRCLGLPTVLHLHAADIMGSYDTLPGLYRAWTRYVFRSASVCIVLGQIWRRWLQDDLGVRAARIEVLRNGVPRAGVVPFPHVGAGCVWVFLGNLQARKGLGDLLAALACDELRSREWVLIVAGGGDAGPFRQRAASLGLRDRVQFETWLSRDACTALLSRASALILPSYHEALPLVLLEAASLGVPSITTPVGAIAEVFTDGENALLVPPGDVGALAAALLRLSDDERLRVRLGRGARRLYERSLSIETFTARLGDIYVRHCSPGRRAA